jgi:hypothetical protein
VLKDKPRTGKYSGKFGAYEQALRIKTPVISPGEKIEIEQYFTGYGEIKSAKGVFYPSDDVFDKKKSYVLVGLKEKEKDLFVFGGERKTFTDTGITFSFAGFIKDGWDESTLFVDIGEGEPPQILTETKQDNAPFEYHLETNQNIRPGTYFIEFCFTYYNGNVWCSSSKTAEFKVQSFFERHDTLIGLVALAATISALVRFAIIPMASWIMERVCQYF